MQVEIMVYMVNINQPFFLVILLTISILGQE